MNELGRIIRLPVLTLTLTWQALFVWPMASVVQHFLSLLEILPKQYNRLRLTPSVSSSSFPVFSNIYTDHATSYVTQT